MKNTKRILAVLLMAALLVSCMLLSVSAEDPFSAEGIDDIEDILEYYELDDYLADNYEDGTWNTQYYSGSNSEVVEDPTNPENKVLKVSGRNNSYSNASETDKLVVSFKLYLDPSMVGEYRLDVKMKDGEGVETQTFNTIFSVNTKAGAFQYSTWDASLNSGEGGFVLTSFDGLTPAFSVWYDIVVFFNAAEGNYNFKISADGGENWTYSGIYMLGNVETMSKFELKSYIQGKNGSILLYLDEVEVYCGSFERNPSNKNNITAETLLDLEAYYLAEGTPNSEKLRIAEVLNQLVNAYGYVPADNTPELEAVNAVIAKTPEYINYAYASELIARAAAIDSEAGYYERLAFLEGIEYYDNVLPENDVLESAPAFSNDAELTEAVKAARALCEAEVAACAKTAEDSAAFITAMSEYDKTSKDYDGYLKNFYDTVSALTERDDTYAEEVVGVVDYTMADAVVDYDEFITKFVRLDTAAQTFIDGATAMKEALEIMNQVADPNDPNLDPAIKEAYEEAFGKLSRGYAAADSVYNGGDIDEDLDESTYALLNSLFDVYTSNKADILARIEACEAFIDIMKKASAATYYTAIVAHITEAESHLGNIRLKYEGMEAAKALYDSLKVSIESSEAASAEYISAVNAIAGKTTFEEKRAAVELALSLKELGDVLGISGVKDANITLSIASAEIDSLIKNSENLIIYVAEARGAATLSERRAILAKAQNAANNSEDTYEGVADAKAELATLIEAYRAEVEAMNASHTAAVKNAASLAGAVAPDEDVYKAGSVIKDFVD